ncbi:MAG TPA: addiction module protein [Bryobacteraceae bacterium]|nr:addiction module protein [Bryobacteraceae bacterium]
MERGINDVLKDTLALPPEARAAVADSLLDSLDLKVDEAAEAVWQSEIASRVQEIDSGATLPIPWAGVRLRLKSGLADGP